VVGLAITFWPLLAWIAAITDALAAFILEHE